MYKMNIACEMSSKIQQLRFFRSNEARKTDAAKKFAFPLDKRLSWCEYIRKDKIYAWRKRNVTKTLTGGDEPKGATDNGYCV